MSEYLDQRVACLAREVNLLKEERKQQSEIISTFHNQLNNRDREIQRLNAMLEGGRPISAVNNDSYQDIERRFSKAMNDKNALQRRNVEIENQLKEAVSKQHEAMNRAVKLAEHNKTLEQEMRDIDRMALAVEAECNSTVKENTKRVCKIQEQLEESLKQIHDLEHDVLEQKRNYQECKAELEAVRNEKQSLQKILENTLEDKKKMNDRINQFTIIEQDLNTEIDRLSQAMNLQRLRIADLESRLLAQGQQSARSDPQEGANPASNSGNKKPVTIRKKKVITKKPIKSVMQPDLKKSSKPASRDPSPSLKEKLDRERQQFETQVKQLALNAPRIPKSTTSFSSSPDQPGNMSVKEHFNATIERLQTERDFYLKEMQQLKDQLGNAPEQQESVNCELRRKLEEKEQCVLDSRHTIRELSREKHNLSVRLENASGPCPPLDNSGVSSIKAVVKRLERERDMARGDVQRLEEERDALRERLKISDLSAHIAGLESQLQSHAEQKGRLEADLSAVRDLCVKLDSQKDDLIEANSEGEVIKMHLENELSRMRDEQNHFQQLLSKDRATVESLEELLAASRQETVEGRMANQELQSEVAILHRRMDDLQERLDSETAEVRRYQTQAAEYSQQIAELRRDVTNEKFERARMSEECRRSCESSSYPRTSSFCPCVVPPPPCPRGYPVPPGAITRTPISTACPMRQPCDYPPRYCPPMPAATSHKPADYSARRASWENRGSRPYSQSVAENYASAPRMSYNQGPPPTITDGPGPGEQTVHCVFTSSGPSVTSASANYTIVRRTGTETTNSTATGMGRNGSYSSAPPQGSKMACVDTSRKYIYTPESQKSNGQAGETKSNATRMSQKGSTYTENSIEIKSTGLSQNGSTYTENPEETKSNKTRMSQKGSTYSENPEEKKQLKFNTSLSQKGSTYTENPKETKSNKSRTSQKGSTHTENSIEIKSTGMSENGSTYTGYTSLEDTDSDQKSEG